MTAGWEASYTATNRVGILTVDDRKALCIGLCHVLAALPDNQRGKSLLALAMPTLDCLDTMTQHATKAQRTERKQDLDIVLDRISSEIVVITTMARAFTDAFSDNDTSMGSGCRISDGRAVIVEPALALIKRAWTSIAKAANTFNFHNVSIYTVDAVSVIFYHLFTNTFIMTTSYNQSISEALGYFLTQCLPPECNDDFSVSFIKELCAIAASMVESISDKRFNAKPVLDFLQNFVRVYGDAIDKDVRGSLEGRAAPSSAERGMEVGKCLETLLLATIAAVDNMLGTTWTSSQRQKRGQPPFESKAEQVEDTRLTSNFALPGVFSLLRTCAEHCPVFLLHLPASAGLDRREDLLLRRAVESAVTSLVEPDEATSESAMEFIEAIIALTNSSTDNVRQIAEDTLSRLRPSILSTLVIGACGNLNAATLDCASRVLLKALAMSRLTEAELQSVLSQALSTDHFQLGTAARNVTFTVLLKGCRNELPEDALFSEFLSDVWTLHQVDSLEALEESDCVQRFCRLHSIA